MSIPRFLCLGLGLLYLGKQERADVMLEAVRTVEHKRGRYAEITLNTCAYAGTGNVLKVRDKDLAKKLLISFLLSISFFDRSLTFFP